MEPIFYNFPEHGSNNDILPLEILTNIYDYLHPQDRLNASTTCRTWLEVTKLSEFRNDFCLHFSKITFGDNFSPAKDFLESFRTFHSIEFVEVEIGECQKFFERHGGSVLHLSFETCDITERRLTEILKECDNLQSLRIESCKELFMSGRLFDQLSKSGLILNNLTSLSLAQNRYLSDSIFSRITALTPNLKSLDMSGLQISFHKGLYRKFYPASQNEPSESVLTFHYISKFIESLAANLKELNFNNTLIDGNALITLSEASNLDLKVLKLKNCEQLTNDGIMSLIKVQTHLQCLDLTQTVRLTDVSLYEICEHLKDLKVLKLRRCRAITDMGIKRIVELEKLEVLDVSECESVTSVALIEGIAKSQNLVMRELYCSAMNICNRAILKVTENFPNLRVLDLSYNFNYVDDLCLQMILKNLIWLRELNLDFCDKVSDAGMTGIKMLDKVREYEKSLNERKEVIPSTKCRDEVVIMNPPIDLGIDNFKISLRSKAEEEIVNDAKRKKAIMELCELNKEQDTNKTSYSIARLRGLRVLKLSACNKVSDVSLKYNFLLPELKEINVSRCHQISSIGIQCLVENCPSLESVDLTECHGINDKSIEILTENLSRLKSLSIQRCNQLTDFTLDYIAMNCKKLKILNMNGCRSISGDPHLRLSNLKFLNDIYCSKAGDQPSALRPLPPPLPMRLF